MKLLTINNKFFTFNIYLSNDGYVHGELVYRYKGKVRRTPIPAYYNGDYGITLPKSVKQELSKSIFIKEIFPELNMTENEPKAL